jgi:hypothetical protein
MEAASSPTNTHLQGSVCLVCPSDHFCSPLFKQALCVSWSRYANEYYMGGLDVLWNHPHSLACRCPLALDRAALRTGYDTPSLRPRTGPSNPLPPLKRLKRGEAHHHLIISTDPDPRVASLCGKLMEEMPRLLSSSLSWERPTVSPDCRAGFVRSGPYRGPAGERKY